MERLTEDAILTLAEGAQETVFLVDRGGIVRYVNARCADTLGFTRSDVIGQPIIELVLPGDRDRTLKEAAQVVAGRDRVGFENRYQHRDGRAIYLAWQANWLHAHQLRMGFARDVTALRQPACEHMLASDLLGLLDPVERDVLVLLLTAASESQIASRLGLGAARTQTLVLSVFRKLGVPGRLGLMSLCLRGLEAPVEA
ncbi:PAS domain S-box protein [Cupriavidus pauculus]|uniref:LuxR family transcriptional regulator n=1 Tax=Cupriavidus pauculus TaxID=82633 RepID=A0A2N5C7Y5_9BURK|nr:PAS domain S-box protein [Cupriavidus pauculus]PLP98333.1 LuxR family transcriptional regulator [Cupriavidus pauculus]